VTFEPVLHPSRSVELEEEAASFVSVVAAGLHLLPKHKGSIRIKLLDD